MVSILYLCGCEWLVIIDYLFVLITVYAIAEEGKLWAQLQLGIKYLQGLDGFDKNVAEGVRYIRMAAEGGYVEAKYCLGTVYHDGEGVSQDYNIALDWLRQAADEGNAFAQYRMGGMYYHGEGVDKDYKEALTWYKKAADQGYNEAQFALGKDVKMFMILCTTCSHMLFVIRITL